jgi:amino-acid N-acetyltransferase
MSALPSTPNPHSAPSPSNPATQAVRTSDAQFVAWLREVAPYVHAHRGRTFVVAIGGELIASGRLNALVQDLSLLHAMGIRVVLVHGSRPQVQAQLALKNIPSRFENGMRVTDAPALECAKEAAGEIRLDIEAAFSQGLPNTPMAHAQVRVVSGNFVTARPVGIVNGIDYQHTGVVRKVDAEAVRFVLNSGSLMLVSPLGFSPTGEAFNLSLDDVAASIAKAVGADKLVLVAGSTGVLDVEGRTYPELTVAQAEGMIASQKVEGDAARHLALAVRACNDGVARAHIVPEALDGGVLVELFTHDGVGTMVSSAHLDALREATIDDLGGLVKLLAPLESDGTLVKRPRERLEREIDRFTVLEHDGVIYGCAALYASSASRTGEMAALTVNPIDQNHGDGARLLARIEARARAEGLQRLFVLTTRTAHWFLKRGFVLASVEDLPIERQQLYNWQRRSQVLMKNL